MTELRACSMMAKNETKIHRKVRSGMLTLRSNQNASCATPLEPIAR